MATDINLALVPTGSDDFDEARSLLGAQREDEALDRFELAITSAPTDEVRVSAAAHVAALLLGFGRPWEVETFTSLVRAHDPALADYLDAAACLQLDDPFGALDRIGDDGDPAIPLDTWFPCPAAGIRAVRARALAAAGRLDAAIHELDIAIGETPDAPAIWETIAAIAADPALDLDPAPYVARLPQESIVRTFGWLHGAPRAGVDAIAEACWLRFGPQTSLVAVVALLAPHLDNARALDWTVRLAQAGATSNPVLDRAESAGLPLSERLRAAAAGAIIDEPRGRAALEQVAAALPDEDIETLALEVLTIAPEVADSYVVAVATTTPRCLALATVLSDHGHAEPALALLVHGLTLAGADDLSPEGFDALVPAPARAALAAAAAAAGDDEIVAILRSVATGSPR